ncbi:MAG: dienelactone hydrolase family protein [Burkholderiales bacterium]
MIEKMADIPTKAGVCDTFVCHPERGGSHPAVIFYMDAPGIREELFDMARRIASVGYYVILPNLYYRTGRGALLTAEATVNESPEQKKMFGLMGTISNGKMAEDTEGLIAWLDAQKEVKKGPFGAVGYCMSGPYAMVAAASYPDRFGAAASLHGVPFVTDQADSAHLMMGNIKGEAYFGFGSIDFLTPKKDVDTLSDALKKTSLKYELEMYENCNHGFVFPGRALYNKPAAERHWERLFALYRRTIG